VASYCRDPESVVHGYFEVDLDILWDVAVIDVPHLADQVRIIRSELGSES